MVALHHGKGVDTAMCWGVGFAWRLLRHLPPRDVGEREGAARQRKVVG
jgi:hypothetical protein